MLKWSAHGAASFWLSCTGAKQGYGTSSCGAVALQNTLFASAGKGSSLGTQSVQRILWWPTPKCLDAGGKAKAGTRFLNFALSPR